MYDSQPKGVITTLRGNEPINDKISYSKWSQF